MGMGKMGYAPYWSRCSNGDGQYAIIKLFPKSLCPICGRMRLRRSIATASVRRGRPSKMCIAVWLGRKLTWEANQLQKRLEDSGGAAIPGETQSTARDSANEELLRVLRQELSEARSRLAVRTFFVLPAPPVSTGSQVYENFFVFCNPQGFLFTLLHS